MVFNEREVIEGLSERDKIFTDKVISIIGKTAMREIKLLMAEGLTRKEAWEIARSFQLTINE